MVKMKGDFTQISNSIIRNTNVTDGAFRTYTILKSYQFDNRPVFPSQQTLAKQRNVSRETISLHIKELRIAMLITCKKRGFAKSNAYNFINCEDNLTSTIRKDNQNTLDELNTNNTKVNKTNSNKTNAAIPKSDDLGIAAQDRIDNLKTIDPNTFKPQTTAQKYALEVWTLLEPDKPNNFRFYLYAIHYVPIDVIREFVTEILRRYEKKLIRNKGAIFVGKVNFYIEERSSKSIASEGLNLFANYGK